MDVNKLKVLQKIEYKIAPVCSLCLHGEFPQNDFGICSIQTYAHLKHSEQTRNLSIHRYGHCDMFTGNQKAIAKLGSYEQFLVKE